jgi:hypothetical protein
MQILHRAGVFVCDRSLIKGIFNLEQHNYFHVSRLPLEAFS